MDFKLLDLKATALDQIVTFKLAKKVSGFLGTMPQANSTNVEKPERDDSLAKIMSAITVLSAKVNCKKSNANKNCTLCLLPGHNLSECHSTKQGLTTSEAYQCVPSLTHAPIDSPKLDSAAMEHVTNDVSVRYTRDNMPCNMQIKVANSQSILQPMRGKLQLIVHDKNMDQINIKRKMTTHIRVGCISCGIDQKPSQPGDPSLFSAEGFSAVLRATVKIRN
eukprot:1833496-Rhodomonas_salina.1